MNKVINTTDLVREFAAGNGPQAMPRRALDGVSVSVDAGEFVAVVGRSGSGKTTLLNIIGGLDRAYSGAVEVMGREISRMNDADLSRFRNSSIGFVFQAFHLLSHLTVIQNVTLPEHFGRGDMKDASERARQALERVGLLSRAASFPHELSAGERQRVAIARAILNRPSIVLCDEPTGNLDALTGQTVIEIFKDLNRQDGTTFLVATHEDRMASVADRVISLVDGRLA
jgi:putative ABC transport system ATP-binding protein